MTKVTFVINTVSGAQRVEGYQSGAPGLVLHRSASGWAVYHYGSGNRLNKFENVFRTQALALEFVRRIAHLVDFTHPWRAIPEEAHIYIGLAQAAQVVAWKKCSDKECLKRDGHPGVHEAAGRKWKTTADDASPYAGRK